MLIIDDLLGAPAKGLMFVLKEINKAVQAEREAEEHRLVQALSELNRRLDAGQIAAAEFDLRERELLDRLDGLRGHGGEDGGDESDR
jgi:hypothetical protein